MTTTYTPREGSVPYKVIAFLTANPDEQLDADLISAKCDCDRRSVHTLLSSAVQAGLLQRSEEPTTGELVYTLGTGTPLKSPAVGGFHAWLDRKGLQSEEARAPRRAAHPPMALQQQAAQKKRTGPYWVDTSSVQIDKGVPMPSRGSKAIDWSPLLDKLAVGDSFQLPAPAKSAIGTAMKAYKDTTGKVLASRKVEGGIRVWRVS